MQRLLQETREMQAQHEAFLVDHYDIAGRLALLVDDAATSRIRAIALRESMPENDGRYDEARYAQRFSGLLECDGDAVYDSYRLRPHAF
jgi:hypothetical protein